MWFIALLASPFLYLSGSWAKAKYVIEHMVAFSHDALHVITGACLQLLFAGFLRGSIRQWRPWLLVLALELANECSDLLPYGWTFRPALWATSAQDILLTMSVPTLTLIVVRWRPQIFR